MGLKKNNPGCKCCDITCTWCTGTVPTTRAVTLGNITNLLCSGCTSLNTTFVCDYVLCTGTPGATGGVRWVYTGTISCGGTSHNVEIELFYGYLNLFSSGWKCDINVTGTYNYVLRFLGTSATPQSATSCTDALSFVYDSASGNACSTSGTPTCSVAAA